MNSRLNVFRVAIFATLLATITACGVDRPDTSSDSGSSDRSSGARPPETEGPPQIDAAPPSEPGANGAPSEDVLTFDGWGPLRIGMTRAEVVAAAGDDAQPQAVGGPEPDRCDQFRPRRAPAGLLVMLENGVLTRISVSRNSDISAPEGIRIGDSSAIVLKAYGSKASVEPHAYWPSPAKYITVWRESGSPDGRRGLRYEIDQNDRVVHLHAGGSSIASVEGCV